MTTQQPRFCCSNGHLQPMTNSKFCIYCGAPVSLLEANYPTPTSPPAVATAPAPHSYPSHPADVHVNRPLVPATPVETGPRIAAPTSSTRGGCNTCGNDGSRLAANRIVCPECRWLRPLVPGYQVDASAFAWAGDAKAMSTLRSIKMLTVAAAAVSEKVGRRWIEVTFNGIRLNEKQLPQIYSQAVRAARVLGMSHMPDLYLSGERPWDMLTFGTDRDSFIVIGSAIAANFNGPDMYFLLARQLGHCKAGHSVWKTVIRFLLGDQGPQKGVLAGGVLNTMLNPTALLSGAIEMPLLGWARQAEITADRAGMLAVGNEEVARRVLMSWSLKSSHLYHQLNMNAWVEQQSLEEDQTLRLSELLTTSTPYLGPRLKLLQQYANSSELKGYLQLIGDSIRRNQPQATAAPGSRQSGSSHPGSRQASSPQARSPQARAPQAKTPATSAVRPAPCNGVAPSQKARPVHEVQNSAVTTLKVICTACGSKLCFPANVLNQVDRRPIRCPNAACGAITLLEKRVQSTSLPSPQTQRQLETMTHGD